MNGSIEREFISNNPTKWEQDIDNLLKLYPTKSADGSTRFACSPPLIFMLETKK